MPAHLPSEEDFFLTLEDPSARTGPQGGVRPPAGAPVRSHLFGGLVVNWRPPAAPAGTRFAVDAEYADQPVPATMARRYGTEDFWTRWTRAEVCAKLADTPILVWLATYGLPADPAAGTGHRLHTLDLAAPDGRTIRVSAGTGTPSSGATTGATTGGTSRAGTGDR